MFGLQIHMQSMEVIGVNKHFKQISTCKYFRKSKFVKNEATGLSIFNMSGTASIRINKVFFSLGPIFAVGASPGSYPTLNKKVRRMLGVSTCATLN